MVGLWELFWREGNGAGSTFRKCKKQMTNWGKRIGVKEMEGKRSILSVLCQLHSFLRRVPFRMECVQDTQIAEKIGREVFLR